MLFSCEDRATSYAEEKLRTGGGIVNNGTDALKTDVNSRIGSCLPCVYRVMDARGKFGEHERSVRVARGDSRELL